MRKGTFCSKTCQSTFNVSVQATDGIFDNVPDTLLIQEMHKVQHCKDFNTIQQTANSIALMARELSRDPKVSVDFLGTFFLEEKNIYKLGTFS